MSSDTVRASRAAASNLNPNKQFLIPAWDDLAIIGKNKTSKYGLDLWFDFVFISGKNKEKFYLN